MSQSLEAVRADAETPTEGVQVTLHTDEGEATVTVPPPGRWDADATEMIAAGRLNSWAELVLSDDDYVAWRALRPRIDDINEFFDAWRVASGEDSGKSRASRRSSRSTARR